MNNNLRIVFYIDKLKQKNVSIPIVNYVVYISINHFFKGFQ